MKGLYSFRLITKYRFSTCPVTGGGGGNNVATKVTKNASKKPLPIDASKLKTIQDIPGPTIYPLVGTAMDLGNYDGVMWKAYRDYYQKYGSVVKVKYDVEEVVVFDPHEFIKVYRSDGKYPVGGITDFWPFTMYMDDRKRKMNIIRSGEVWKEARNHVQSDILSPQSAASYMPFLAPVARDASEKFGDLSSDIEKFSSRAIFDMFAAAMCGRTYDTINEEKASPKDLECVANTIEVNAYAGNLLFSPLQKWLSGYIHTKDFKTYASMMDKLMDHSRDWAREAIASAPLYAEGKTVTSKYGGAVPYAVKLSQRDINEDEMTEFLAFLLLAGVDTTANTFTWLLYDIANNPQAQQKLREELKLVLNGEDFSKSASLPYLRACMRESHRHHSVVPTMTTRYLQEDTEVGGYFLEKGTKVSFNPISMQHDPKIVDNPEEFRPERWLPDAVKSRVGTPAEILDNRLVGAPFSFGPRMCLGGR